jgi:hypothetical protein
MAIIGKCTYLHKTEKFSEIVTTGNIAKAARRCGVNGTVESFVELADMLTKEKK